MLSAYFEGVRPVRSTLRRAGTACLVTVGRRPDRLITVMLSAGAFAPCVQGHGRCEPSGDCGQDPVDPRAEAWSQRRRAFVYDPDGNNLETVCQRPVSRP
jgi:hypothetical protein